MRSNNTSKTNEQNHRQPSRGERPSANRRLKNALVMIESQEPAGHKYDHRASDKVGEDLFLIEESIFMNF